LLAGIVTQNVDGLHQRAGSLAVVDLHGRLDTVRCLSCEARLHRSVWQAVLCQANPAWTSTSAGLAPDGDAVPGTADDVHFHVPGCPGCGGIMKPDVVFYGEAIPPAVRAAAQVAIERAEALLVIGSSLMVYSAFRLVRDAVAAGKPVAAINLGRTRADELLAHHWREDCALAVPALADQLADELAGGR